MRMEREAAARDKSARVKSAEPDHGYDSSERFARASQFDLQRYVRLAKWGGLVLLVAIFVALAAWGVRSVGRLPIEQLRFVGDVRAEDRIDPAELERLTKEVKGGIGTVDILALQAAFKRVPWVREAVVRRRFPSMIEVRIEAHKPLARWGEFDLVNSYGERFTATTTDALPRLLGPDGSTQEVAQQFMEFQKLARASGSDIEEVSLNNRRAWQVKLKSGPVVELGRVDEISRLARALALMEFLPQIAAATNIDARYAQGIAVRKP
jgi:cell division protein FtsQ